MKNINLRPADATPVIVGCLAIVVDATSAPVPLRALLTFSFAGICPGWTAISTFAPRDRVERIIIAIALSLALDTIVTELLALRHEFTALTSLVVLTILMIGKLAFTGWRVGERIRRVSAVTTSLARKRIPRMLTFTASLVRANIRRLAVFTASLVRTRIPRMLAFTASLVRESLRRTSASTSSFVRESLRRMSAFTALWARETLRRVAASTSRTSDVIKEEQE